MTMSKVHETKNVKCNRLSVYFKERITKCSNELYNKFTNIRQHNNYLLGHIGYMFRLVIRSLSGPQQNESKVPLENWDPNILYSCKKKM